DVDWLTLQSRFDREPWSGLRGRVGMRSVLAIVRRRCAEALAAVDACFVTSAEDEQAVADLEIHPTRDCKVLPNLAFPPGAIDPSPLNLQSQDVLFVGDLQFPPNRHGLGRFLEHVWPRVSAARPQARFRIVGRGLEQADSAVRAKIPGVEPIGYVDDLTAVYDKSAV